jgi:biopolymer transport protein TolR
MGMSTGGNKGGVQSEINVTPLIDVLLVLLIIFLVVMPVMMRMETLQTPPKITDDVAPDPEASMLTIKVNPDLSVSFGDGNTEKQIQAADVPRELRPKLEALKADKRVVFVDFDPRVPWNAVVSTMDSIRSLASDVANHDEIKVALKIRDDSAAAQGQ